MLFYDLFTTGQGTRRMRGGGFEEAFDVGCFLCTEFIIFINAVYKVWPYQTTREFDDGHQYHHSCSLQHSGKTC